MKIAYRKEVKVHTCVGDQGGPESQPYHAGWWQRAPGGGLGRRAVGPSGPSHRSFAHGALQRVCNSVMAFS